MTEAQDRIKADAEHLRHCLGNSLCTVVDVVAWADREISVAECVDPRLIDIAMATKSSPQNVLALLWAVLGEVEPAEVRRRFFGQLAALLRREPGLGPRIALAIEAVVRFDEACHDVAGGWPEGSYFLYYSELECSGEDERDITRRMLAFLEANAPGIEEESIMDFPISPNAFRRF